MKDNKTITIAEHGMTLTISGPTGGPSLQDMLQLTADALHAWGYRFNGDLVTNDTEEGRE
jgi:hypothetical protein